MKIVRLALLSLLVLTAAQAVETWTWSGAWPAGWVGTEGEGWTVERDRLIVRTAADGSLPHVATGVLGPHAEVRFDLVSPADPALLGLSFGLSAGDPALASRRAVQLGFVPDGQLAWFDGERWRSLWAVPTATPVAITLTLARDRGQLTVAQRSAGGAVQQSAPFPFWNQVGFADTVFLGHAEPDGTGANETVVRSVTAHSDPRQPPSPRLDVARLGGKAVRLRWTPLGEAEGFRVFRDGVLLTTRPAGSYVYVDEAVQARTRYEYRVEALGAGSSPTRALVTGPETEIRPGNAAYEVVIYGATPGGVAAAVALGERGRRVALIEPEDVVGGMISGGLSRTDFGSIHALGGLFQRFIDQVAEHYLTTYGADSPQAKVMRDGLYFEPQVARSILLGWLAELPTVSLLRGAHLVGADGVNGRVTSILIDHRDRALRFKLRAPFFIDASYEGDLAALAGADYLIGRESADEYGEEHAGELWWDVWERKVVEKVGTGDRRVQAYCYRLCLSRDIDRRLPPPRPATYDRQRYVSLLPEIEAGKLNSLKDILSILELPNSKADANNHPQGNPSSDLIGGADAYPEAGWDEREVIRQAHRDHILGLLWFLRFDPAVPEPVRLDAQRWGLARDEFPETDGWPSQLYVREGRRIVGDTIFTEANARQADGSERSPHQRDSIAVGAYPIDSHATGGRHPDHPDWLEGFFYLARGETKPYSIPYAVMVPRGLDNVLVCGCVSSTHVGYGTLRMEPVFMGLGLAAGIAAEHVLREETDVRGVLLPRIQRDLLAENQVLAVFEDVGTETPGRDGFNLLGAYGAFDSYQAIPDEPITGEAFRRWLRATRWPEFTAAARVVSAGEAPLSGEQVTAVLRQVATSLKTASPRLDGETVSRAETMAALWRLIQYRIR